MYLIITMIVLAVAIFFTLIKMIISPVIWERLLAVNLISAKTILLLALYGIYRENIFFLDVAIAYGIIGFLGITLISRFILGGGRLK